MPTRPRRRRKLESHRLDTTLPPYHYRHKAGGWMFLNGNIPNPRDLVLMFRDRILQPMHPDPEINRERRVILITAAFDSGQEFNDRHLIHDFEVIGLDAGWKGGYPTRVRNLAVWNSFLKWKESEKWLYQRYTEKQDAIQAIKQDYHIKMQVYVTRVLESLRTLSGTYPDLGLYEFYQLDNWSPDPSTSLAEERRSNEEVEREIKELLKSRVDSDRARELRNQLDHLVYKDREVLAACKAIDDHFRYESGIEKNELYQAQRTALLQTLREAATIFIYGGRVYVLMNRLRFYGLDEGLVRAVEDGTNVFGISAGSCIQSDQFSLALPNAPSGGHQIAADVGTGILEYIRVFPHAYDYYQYIREGSRNDLSFFALRHPGCVVVGLNQESVLLRESYRCPADGQKYLRFTSVGPQPVLVFGPRGRRYDMNGGDQLLVPGTRSYAGTLQLARVHEVEAQEADCLFDPGAASGS